MMSDNIETILNSLNTKNLEKNKGLIQEFLNSKEGQEIASQINQMDKEDLMNLINSVPKSKIDKALNNPDNLKKLANDPKSLEKIKKKLR